MDNQESKFNFSEEEEQKAQDKIVEESKEAVVNCLWRKRSII